MTIPTFNNSFFAEEIVSTEVNEETINEYIDQENLINSDLETMENIVDDNISNENDAINENEIPLNENKNPEESEIYYINSEENDLLPEINIDKQEFEYLNRIFEQISSEPREKAQEYLKEKAEEEYQNSLIQVYIKSSSVEEDLEISLRDKNNRVLNKDTFTVNVSGENYSKDWKITNGWLKLNKLPAGEYTVSFVEKEGYIAPEDIICKVVEKVAYEKVEVEDQIKDETEINASEDDPNFGKPSHGGNSNEQIQPEIKPIETPKPTPSPTPVVTPKPTQKPTPTPVITPSPTPKIEIKYKAVLSNNGKLLFANNTETDLYPIYDNEGFIIKAYREIIEEPEITPSPTPSITPEATITPEVTVTPEVTPRPTPSEIPEETVKPSEEPKETIAPETTENPSPSPSSTTETIPEEETNSQSTPEINPDELNEILDEELENPVQILSLDEIVPLTNSKIEEVEIFDKDGKPLKNEKGEYIYLLEKVEIKEEVKPTQTPSQESTPDPEISPSTTPSATPEQTPDATPTPSQKPVLTGWQTVDGKTYYYDANGNKVTGTQIIEGKTYYFNSKGEKVDRVLAIDVSKYQYDINWKEVKKAGVDYAIIRLGYRGYQTGSLVVDPYYYQNIKNATAAGIKVGVYFFSQAVNTQEAVEEASMCLDYIKGYNVDLPIYFDTEYVGNNARADGLSANHRTSIAVAFCETIENAGHRAGVYASKSWFYNQLEFNRISKYSIWVAHYTSAESTDFKYNYDIWQYTGSGSCAGIGTAVDKNIIYNTSFK